MKLVKRGSKNLFEIPGFVGHVRFGVYWKNANVSSFEFDDTFIRKSSNRWFLFFYREDLNIDDLKKAAAEAFVDGLSGSNAAIVWAEQLNGNQPFSQARIFNLKKNEISKAVLSPDQDRTNRRQLSFTGFRKSTLSIHSSGNLIVEPRAGRYQRFSVNDSSCELLGCEIGVTSKTGEIIFQSSFSQKYSLPIVIPHVSGLKLEQFSNPQFVSYSVEPTVIYKLADESGMEGQTLIGSYLPFDRGEESLFRFAQIDQPVTSLIPTMTGEKVQINDIANLTFKINQIKINQKAHLQNRYFLIPTGGEINLEAEEFLVGNTGTESLKKSNLGVLSKTIRLSFSETSDSIIYDDKDFSPDLTGLADSFTSKIKIKESTDFRIDSERSPLFTNERNANLLGEWSSNYEPLLKGRLSGDQDLPFIPTLSIAKDDQDLKNLDKIFAMKRIRKIQNDSVPLENLLSSAKSQITPQGFTKTDSRYDMIKQVNRSTGNFEFSIDNYDDDLELSIRKNEVFFVLTPEIFRKYRESVSAKLNAKFAVNKTDNEDLEFIFNITGAYQSDITQKASHKDSIIIFKFNKKSIAELIQDTSNWSNEEQPGASGGFNKLRYQLDLAKSAINDAIKFKDEYFEDSILNNPNWNGVLILNIPLGDASNLPQLFTGLSSSQQISKEDATPSSSSGESKIKLETVLKFQYVAIPVNKTFVGSTGVQIASTAFFGLIDYDPFKSEKDYARISDHLKKDKTWRFVLSKLRVVFQNSNIAEFESYSFLMIPDLFENRVDFQELELSHPSNRYPHNDDVIDNLIRLEGIYQKNEEIEEFAFKAHANVLIGFDGSNILKSITLSQLGFSWDGKNYRFDISALATTGDWLQDIKDIISINSLKFENIGLKLKMNGGAIPDISFDVSKLALFPDISFDGEGFLSSFPIKFSHFKVFDVKGGKPDNDFFTLPGSNFPAGSGSNLYSLVFNFDLGTLGDLEALKKLKGQLYFGWTGKGGFALGFKLAGPSSSGLNLDLFGALKIEIDDVGFGKFKKNGDTECSTYFLRLNNARIRIFDLSLPPDSINFNGIIIADFGLGNTQRIAWLINLADNEADKLLLGIGQRMGPGIDGDTTKEMIMNSQKTFELDLAKIDPCATPNFAEKLNFRPDRNWLIASESVFGIFGSHWENLVDFRFIFNDPVMYGIFLGLKSQTGGSSAWDGLSIDILYKKISDNLGVWSSELQLPDSVRYQEFGAASLTFPNIGVDIFTNGDWKLDIGYPFKSSDWYRAFQIQVFPFVGWAGIYLTKVRSVNLTIFGPYRNKLGDVDIIQAGAAMRIGLGKYIHKGPFHAGASISVYAILEGAFAFNKGESGLSRLFPDHFALFGRVGAIAEVVGYVDFRIVKAGVHIFLQVEIGMLLAVIKGDLQPVPLYIEGRVGVRIRVTIACFKVFGKRFCIHVTFTFSTVVRFQWTLGGGSKKNLLGEAFKAIETPISISIGELPIIYIPSISKKSESETVLVHNFAINFFGYGIKNGKLEIQKNNVLKKSIIDPIFEELINGQSLTTYESLRTALIDDRESNTKFVFDFSSYVPTLYHGYDLDNDEAYVKGVYGLSDSEYAKFKASVNANICESNPEECSFRPLIVPVGDQINIKGNGDEKIWKDGYSIEIKKLFKDGQGNSTIDNPIQSLFYSEDEVEKMDQHFDSYKSQFFDRLNDEKQALAAQNIDLRYKQVIDEYFKLLGLLTLEACFNEFIDTAFEGKEKPNPEEVGIALINTGNKVFEFSHSDHSSTVKVNPNDVLETVVGQMNYFYNSGLRLLDVTGSNKTKPFWETLEQTTSIKIPNNVYYDNVEINLKKGNEKVALVDELFDGEQGLKEFIQVGKKIRDIDPNDLRDEFNFDDVFQDPFRLIPSSFALLKPVMVEKNKGGTVKNRFVELPAKIQTKDLEIVYDYKVEKEQDQPVGFTSCVNIEVESRFIRKDVNGIVLEMVNVRIDDLNLANLVSKDQGRVPQSITQFVKIGSAKDGIDLYDLGESTIVKTNLSTRTYPPIITNQLNLEIGFLQSDLKFYAESSNVKRYTELFWQGLTTNNGGYYLVLNKDAFNGLSIDNSVPLKLIFSLTYGDLNVPSYCNALKISSTQVTSKDELLLKDIYQNEMLLQEYHSSVPSHCALMKVNRTLTNSLHNQFLPLEYEIKQGTSTMLSRENVLPISPKNTSEEDSTGKMVLSESDLLYEHVTPLGSGATLFNRYKGVGETFNFHFGLRDIYGHRFIEELGQPVKYVHKYFDKLIPINAWPLITFSPQLVKVSDDRLEWNLVIEVDETTYNTYKGQADQETKEQLATIIAQIADPNCHVNVLSGGTKIKVPEKKLEGLLKSLFDESWTNNKPALSIPYTTKLNTLKTELNASVEIIREVANHFFVIEEKPEYLESGSIRSVSSPITLDTAKGLSSNDLSRFEELIKRINSSSVKLTVGIGSNRKGEKKVFIIKTQPLDKLLANKTINPSSFHAPRPFSNKLWSGNYKYPGGIAIYKDIDLDSGLRLILAEIESLLSGNNLLKLIGEKETLNNLIRIKEELSKNGGRLSEKVEALDEEGAKPHKSFDEIIAKSLDNFYKYDGMISLPIDKDDLLAAHRLTISMKEPQSEYDISSSKIDFTESHTQWDIWFDNKTNNVDASNASPHELKFIPEVTHIEYNIFSSGELQGSDWIQLVEPYQLVKDPYLVNFPSIVRQFPPKPELIRHEYDYNRKLTKWSQKAGKWDYRLGLKDQGYTVGDRLNIVLQTKSLVSFNLLGDPNKTFEGAIAYWSEKIINGQISSKNEVKKFIEDLLSTLTEVKAQFDRFLGDDIMLEFNLRKGTSGWEIESPENQLLKLMHSGNGIVDIEDLVFTGANVLDKDRDIVAILPSMFIVRNEQGIKNPRFHYQTQTVKPMSWVVPLLNYFEPLTIEATELFSTDVFDSIPTSLPYKATLRYLLNTEGKQDYEGLPSIPIQQKELNAGDKPRESDTLFRNFENGNEAITLTIYNESDSETSLPIMYVESIVKKNQ